MNVKLKQCVRQLMQSQQGWSQRETQSPEENLVRFTVCATVSRVLIQSFPQLWINKGRVLPI